MDERDERTENLEKKLEGGLELPRNEEKNLGQGLKFNSEMVGGPLLPSPKAEKPIKKVVMIISGIIITSLLATLVYLALFSKPPTIPTPVATPKPVTATIKLRGEELGALKYGTDYFVDVSGRNYLITVLSAPKRLIYNGKEVYRGEDLKNAVLSADGKHWAMQKVRQEQRTKRDDNTKILQNTQVEVATFVVDGNQWGEKDNSRLVALNINGNPQFIQTTGVQTPSQYGEALDEQIVFNGQEEIFKTSYGILEYETDSSGKNWLATTNNPSTNEVVDFFVNGSKGDSLDARILKRISLDEDGNYLLAFCKEGSDSVGIGLIGKDCQISVNSKTRTTIAGTVFLSKTLGKDETYAGIDKELQQSFSKNSRLDLELEHRKDFEEDPATIFGVYLNQSGEKFAITTSRNIAETQTDGTVENKFRLNLSINSAVIDNSVDSASLLSFGFGEDDQTLFIYELPEKAVKEVPRVEEVTPAPAS
jgi:hypothetical protein